MSSHHQLQPLTIDEESNEPYLRLPDPHSHIIITPFRLQDALDIVPILNDERVYKWMTGPPYPYLLEDAEAWITMMKEKSDKLVETLGKAPGLEELQLVDGCPVHTLREVKEDGKQVFLGDISFIRCRWDDLDADQRKKLVDENESRVPGDPELIWSVGGASGRSFQRVIQRHLIIATRLHKTKSSGTRYYDCGPGHINANMVYTHDGHASNESECTHWERRKR